MCNDVFVLQVADFDFNTAEEEELQYKTFWERLCESFGMIIHIILNSTLYLNLILFRGRHVAGGGWGATKGPGPLCFFVYSSLVELNLS